MPTVKMVEYEDASPEVRAVYDDIMSTRKTDSVNNFWKTIAVHPPTLARTWRDLKEVMAPGRLDPLTKEMIAIAVSATNGCAYCVTHFECPALVCNDDEKHMEIDPVLCVGCGVCVHVCPKHALKEKEKNLN